MNYIITLTLLLVYHVTFSQVKLEREYALPISEVPTKASSFTKEYFGDLKLKWFAEESDKGKSIEAKSFKKGKTFSIEFSHDGELQDIEKKIKFSSLNAPTKQAIISKLKSDFDKFKIRKTQVQWSGELEAVKQYLMSEKVSSGLTIAYEIEVEGRTNSNSKMYEYLFTEKGEHIEKKQIVTRSTFNLEF